MEQTSDNATTETQTPAPESTGSMGDMLSRMAGNAATEPAAEPAASADNGEKDEGKKETAGKSAPAWTSQLNDEIKGNADLMAKLSGFEKISDMAKAYAELSAKDPGLALPGEDADEATVNAFYEKLGKPKDAAGYGLAEHQKFFAEIALKNNLTTKQAQAVVESMTAWGNAQIEKNKAAIQQSQKLLDEAMRTEYGTKYSEKVAMLERGILAAGGQEIGKALMDAGLLYHPAMAKMFIKIGELNAESGSMNKSSGGKGYKSTADGGTFTFKGL